MRLNDHLIGAAAILGGASILYAASGFREVPGQVYGSAFFPSIVALIAIVAGGLQIAVAPRGEPWITPAPWLSTRAGLKALATVAAVVLWLLLADQLGFLATTFLIVTGLALVLGAPPLGSILVAAGISAVLHLVFSELLRVPLPRGFIEAILP